MKKIIWLIAHEPRYLFERTARAFSQKIAALTGGEIQIEPMTAIEYRDRFGVDFNEVDPGQLWDALFQDRVQMSQTQVHHFGHWDKNYRVFDMPFLFRDHEHATKVLEGAVCRTMGDRLGREVGLHGLSFTYSGGFRVFGANKPFESARDLVGKRVRTNQNPVNADFVSSIGAHPKALNNYGYDAIADGSLDATETTYIRFLGKHVLKTEHNMFLTTIVVNDQLWQTLTDQQKTLFREAAIDTARLERQWSVEDAEQFEKNCERNGVTITHISDSDKEYLRKLSHSVYEKWEPYFMPGLIDIIKNRH